MIATKKKPYKAEGIWNYPELPAGMHQATLIDFSVLTDELIFGINILFKPDVLQDYQAWNIATASEMEKWKTEILAGKVYIEKIPYKESGLWYYPNFPLGCRKAVWSDFFTAGDEIIPGIAFLVLGTQSTDYEAHRTSTAERFATWLNWLPAGRIYINSAL